MKKIIRLTESDLVRLSKRVIKEQQDKNKLNNVIFKYLDMKYGALEQKKGKYVDIVFHFPGEEYGKLGWEKPEILYVYDVLMNEISNYFGMESDDSLRVIGKWVEDRYNLKVINTYFCTFIHWRPLKIDTI